MFGKKSRERIKKLEGRLGKLQNNFESFRQSSIDDIWILKNPLIPNGTFVKRCKKKFKIVKGEVKNISRRTFDGLYFPRFSSEEVCNSYTILNVETEEVETVSEYDFKVIKKWNK